MITSKKNEEIKWAKSLSNPKDQKKESAFLLEGTKMIEEALLSGIKIRKVFYGPNLKEEKAKSLLVKLSAKKADVLLVSSDIISHLSEQVNPEEIIAAADFFTVPSDNLFSSQPSLFLWLDRVQDPGNLGTIIRTCVCAGVKGLFLSEGTVSVYNPKVLRASMGSIFRLPIVKVQSPEKLIKQFHDHHIEIIAATPKAEKNFSDHNYTSNTVFLLGNESQGISLSLENMSDVKIKIPLFGSGESLNVAVAAGILLYLRHVVSGD